MCSTDIERLTDPVKKGGYGCHMVELDMCALGAMDEHVIHIKIWMGPTALASNADALVYPAACQPWREEAQHATICKGSGPLREELSRTRQRDGSEWC